MGTSEGGDAPSEMANARQEEQRLSEVQREAYEVVRLEDFGCPPLPDQYRDHETGDGGPDHGCLVIVSAVISVLFSSRIGML